MSLLTAATWILATLLVAAGSGKARRPTATGAALRTADLPSSPKLVRLLGAGEIALGSAVALAGGPVPAGLLAVAYGAFGWFARRQLAAGEDCGCFGDADAPVTALHVWFDVGAATVAATAVVRPVVGLPALAAPDLLTAAAAAVAVVVTAGLLQVLLTAAVDLHTALALLEPDDRS